MSHVSSSRASARLALCLAVLLAFVAANPVEGTKFWKWRKAKAAAKWNDADDESDGAWSRRAAAWKRDDDDGGDGDCDDCGTWWRAKRWRDASWWSKWSKKPTARDEDSDWVPGARLKVAKCMLGKCGWQLKKCRKDTACRAAVQCAVGCGLGADAESRGCAFQCALENTNDITRATFGCVLERGCIASPA